MATAALLAGFGAAILIYGPLGTPSRQLAGTTLNVPPKGVYFGNAMVTLASGLDLTNATAGNASWQWVNQTTGNLSGPCNQSGVLYQNGTYNATNNVSTAANVTGGNTTLVCLNSVNNGLLNATWYYNESGFQVINNTYNSTNWLPNGSYYNASGQNISSCNNNNTWNETHLYGNSSFRPCDTYYEMNNNTTFLTSGGGQGHNATTYNNSTIWSPNQTGYAPNDVVYEIPVIFGNNSMNGTYEISVAIEGVTPVVQTFFFNNTCGNTTPGALSGTVLFTFDMTIAWLMDVTVSQNGTLNGTASNTTGVTPVIYGAIGVVSSIVTECGETAAGQFICPVVNGRGL